MPGSDVRARSNSASRQRRPVATAAEPSASLKTLQVRARMLHWLRGFFQDHDYWEVQTPLLSHDVCVDAWLEPFRVPIGACDEAGQRSMYLQTSPEFAMKRMIAAGATAIYQITPAFRVAEAGPHHNPEFTIVEWYRTEDTYRDQMAFTEELVVRFLEQANELCPDPQRELESCTLLRPFPRITYADAFRDVFGQDVVITPTSELRHLAAHKSVTPPASLAMDDRDGWLNLLLVEVVEPALAERPAVFLQDYPASQAALACVRQENPPVAERFELYLRGVEICNGYQELTDAEEFRRRVRVQSRRRDEAGLPPLPSESRLLEVMEAGLPECAGVALGFDRLLMIGLGLSTIDEVLAFPFDRA